MREHTVPAEVDNRGYCTFGAPARCDTELVCMFSDNCGPSRINSHTHEGEKDVLFPRKITGKAYYRNEYEHKIEDGVGP